MMTVSDVSCDMADKTSFREMKSSDLYNALIAELRNVHVNDIDRLLSAFQSRLRNQVDTIRDEPREIMRGQLLMSALRNLGVSIADIYAVFQEVGLHECVKLIRDSFPSLKKSSFNSNNNNKSNEITNEVNSSLSEVHTDQILPQPGSPIGTKEAVTSEMLLSSSAFESQLSTTSSSILLKTNAANNVNSNDAIDFDEQASKQVIALYELLMPVYVQSASEATKDESLSFGGSGDSSGSGGGLGISSSVWSSQTQSQWDGTFSGIELPERNLKMKRRMFYNVFDYIRELNMIKHRHKNLYTAEFIYKGYNDKNFYLLYSLESIRSMYLHEFAQNIRDTHTPDKYDPFDQMDILVDITSALAYLHEITDQKDKKILHGDLKPENIIIEENYKLFNQYDHKKIAYTAKLYNFERSIEIRRDQISLCENEIRQELYNLGLIILLVLSWHQFERDECEKIISFDDKNEIYMRLKLHTTNEFNPLKNRLFIKLISLLKLKTSNNKFDIDNAVKNLHMFTKDIKEKFKTIYEDLMSKSKQKKF